MLSEISSTADYIIVITRKAFFCRTWQKLWPVIP